jgi:hypothetical protein
MGGSFNLYGITDDDVARHEADELAILTSYDELRAAPELNPHADNQRPTVWEPAQTYLENEERTPAASAWVESIRELVRGAA